MAQAFWKASVVSIRPSHNDLIRPNLQVVVAQSTVHQNDEDIPLHLFHLRVCELCETQFHTALQGLLGFAENGLPVVGLDIALINHFGF